jgi:hypothetical protein
MCSTLQPIVGSYFPMCPQVNGLIWMGARQLCHVPLCQNLLANDSWNWRPALFVWRLLRQTCSCPGAKLRAFYVTQRGQSLATGTSSYVPNVRRRRLMSWPMGIGAKGTLELILKPNQCGSMRFSAWKWLKLMWTIIRNWFANVQITPELPFWPHHVWCLLAWTSFILYDFRLLLNPPGANPLIPA